MSHMPCAQNETLKNKNTPLPVYAVLTLTLSTYADNYFVLLILYWASCLIHLEARYSSLQLIRFHFNALKYLMKFRILYPVDYKSM